MKRSDVPQDQAGSLDGKRKALYATDADGRYVVVPSTGWDAEDIVLQQAIAHFEALAQEALARCRSGSASPLEYHMYANRMDATLLAQSCGMLKWRVRRHLRPDVFARLPNRLLERYGAALGMSTDALRSLP